MMKEDSTDAIASTGAAAGSPAGPANAANDPSVGVPVFDVAKIAGLPPPALPKDPSLVPPEIETPETAKPGLDKPGAGKSGGTEEIPTILLVQAGLTVFNAMIVLIYIALWMIDLSVLASVLRVGAGFALLLALAPMGLGAYLVRRARTTSTEPPGMIWAHAGVYAGVVMCTLTLMIPLMVTVRAVISGQ